ncbi:MAG: hypothetical protein U0L52_05070 [Bacteroidaceae bacterium]|nr:hypothetical protein [Bacteroidaceae bacterium]
MNVAWADTLDKKTVTFDFTGLRASTRATLTELTMTDLWIFDYMGDALQQSVHQSSTDAAFGSPSLSLDYGDHTFYFVASRGSDPVVDTDAKTIIWGSVRDTFLGSLAMNVQPNSGSSQSVSLSRCVGRFRVSATDVVPEGAAKLVVSPSSWYYGLNYQSGEGVSDSPTPLAVNIPNSYIGTQNLVASFYTISSASPWQTDVTVALMASDESTIGSITISDVPLQRNHVTSYAGGIVGAGRTLNLGSNDEWVEDETVSW